MKYSYSGKVFLCGELSKIEPIVNSMCVLVESYGGACVYNGGCLFDFILPGDLELLNRFCFFCAGFREVDSFSWSRVVVPDDEDNKGW